MSDKLSQISKLRCAKKAKRDISVEAGDALNSNYRAPELILQDQNYDFSVDIWGLGCVLAELIAFSTVYNGHDQPFLDERILFLQSQSEGSQKL